MLNIKKTAGFLALFVVATTNVVLAETSQDASFDWSDLVRSPAAGRSPRTDLAYDRFIDSLTVGGYPEAEITAKQTLEQLLQEVGQDSAAIAQALVNLAVAQNLLADHASAILNYQSAIQLIEGRNDRLSPDLVAPLRGLAQAYSASTEAALAMRTLKRALHISNVNAGPHNPGQVPILESMLRESLRQQDDGAALALLDRIYLLNVREHSPDAEELIPTLFYKADVEARLGLLLEERESYRRIISIARHNRGEHDLSLIRPYMGMARTLRADAHEVVFRSMPTAPTAEWYLKEALEVAKAHPEVDPLIRNECLLALADHYTLAGVHGKAETLYRQSWALLSSNPAHAEQRRKELEGNQPLAQGHPHDYANFAYGSDIHEADADELLQGFVELGYTIDPAGRTTDLAIVAAEPAGFSRMETRVWQAVRSFVFRPRLADGRTVASPGQRYRHEYHYRLSDLETPANP